MRNVDARRTWKSKRLLAVALGLALAANSAGAVSFGIDTHTANPMQPAVGCTNGACHGPASQAVTVTITGPDELVVDEVGNYTISIEGATQVGAGVLVAAFMDGVLTDIQDGILSEDDTASQITQPGQFGGTGQLTHFLARDNAAGKFSYAFSVQAPPEPGMLELRGAMNAFNNDFSNLGDNWNTTSLFVPEPSTTLLGVGAFATLLSIRRRLAA